MKDDMGRAQAVLEQAAIAKDDPRRAEKVLAILDEAIAFQPVPDPNARGDLAGAGHQG